MNIKEGEYVITVSGEIGKVLEVDLLGVTLDRIGSIYYDDILDHNYSLNKLVEAGDFVNGARVYESGPSRMLCLNGNSIDSVDILQMMTKKKFYRECYSPKGSGPTIEWRDIKDFPNYEVSNTGVVRSKSTGRYMKLLGDREQCSVRLESEDGRRLRKSVAVLVLEAFNSPADGRLPRYIDGDVQNCNITNLEWETRDEQMKRVMHSNSYIAKRYKYKYIVGYIMSKPVLVARHTGELMVILKTYIADFKDLTSNHLARSVRTGIPYKGIKLECVNERVFNNLQKSVDNSKLGDYYRELVENKPKQQTKEVKPKKKVNKKREYNPFDYIPLRVSKTNLDDLSDDDFIKDMENEKREKFKQEMMKRLKGDK